MADDGDWAWDLYKELPQLWTVLYHSSPFDFLTDPRAHDATQQALDEPLRTSDDQPQFYDPAKPKKSVKRTSTRVKYDLTLFNLCFGQKARRPRSPDRVFLDRNNADMVDVRYRTPPLEEFTGYVEPDGFEPLVFEELNACQFRVYYTDADRKAKNQNWFRAGSSAEPRFSQ